MRKIDRTGIRYGRLIVLRQGPHRGKFIRWLCRCDCGTETIVYGGSLQQGHTTSCGCLADETAGQSQKTHGEGHRPTKEYKTWLGIKARCYRKTERAYRHYGAKGIKVCHRWLESYGAFLADMGRAPSNKYSIERKDSKKDYEPSNCYWATSVQQNNNTSRNVIIYRPDGSRMTMAQLARESGVRYQTLRNRLLRGLPYHELISP